MDKPDLSMWLKKAKASALADECGMFLVHNGIVRATAKKQVRDGIECSCVESMDFSYDSAGVSAALKQARSMPGIKYVDIWLNEGHLSVGDDIMYVIVGGDIRPRVIDCLQFLVSELKNHCVTEKENIINK